MRLVLLLITCALLWSLESRPDRSRARRALPNIALAALVIAVSLALSTGVAAVSGTRGGIVNAVLGIAALDLAAYGAHVALHKSALAWRFHRVHHSEPEVDVTTALRQHPGETLWRVAWQLLPIVALGLPFGVVVLYQTLSTLNAQLEHANLRLPERADRMLRLLFVTPNMHKVHHSRLQRETDSNYANLFSLWDRLFGTYTPATDLDALRYGLDGFDEPQSLGALLRLPFAS
jgi:sterol desaturase/sphingolipid hydroxylase (fatty acid hydroxylase superfamily)